MLLEQRLDVLSALVAEVLLRPGTILATAIAYVVEAYIGLIYAVVAEGIGLRISTRDTLAIIIVLVR